MTVFNPTRNNDPRWRGCESKRAYRSMAKARHAARRVQRDFRQAVQPYACRFASPEDAHFHIGHPPSQGAPSAWKLYATGVVRAAAAE